MRRLDLVGTHVLLTGAAGGIGTALAHTLLARGVARLVLVDRDRPGLEQLKQALEAGAAASGGELGFITDLVQVDLSSPAALARLAQDLGDARLDVLIHNAGVAPGGSFAAMDERAIEAALDVNLRAALSLTRRLLPRLLERPRAAIIFVASGSSLLAPGGMAAYAASKFGMVGLAEALRAELAGQGVGVGVVCPPFVRTNIVRNSVPDPDALSGEDAARLARLEHLVQHRGWRPERVARRILRALERNQGRVVLGALPRALIALRFCWPWAADTLNRLNYQKLVKDGVIR